MLKLSPLCLAAVLLLQLPFSAVHAAPVAASVDPAVAASIDAAIAPYYKATDPGATLIVTRDGKTVLRKAYGMANVAAKVPMREDTSLRLGSITKQFTSTAILMLVDEGKVAVTDPITKFLPDYPTHGKLITVEHLLTHTSGIVSYTSKPDFQSSMTRDLTVQQMIDTFKNDKLEFDPGTRYAYNNSGYFLLGAIIEKVSGMPYAKFVEQRIFVPLEMTQTAYEGFERAPTMRAAGHSSGPSGFTPSPPLSMSQPYAAGSLVSTVDDLARWDAAIASGKLLKASSWSKAFTPYTLADGKSTDYGYGWSVGKLRGSPVIGHGGGINGFSTYALRLPEQKVYVAVLTNLDGGMVAPEMVAKKAGAIAIGKPYPQYKAIAMDAAALDAYAGTYKIDDKASRTVRREGDHLVMQRSGRRPVDLVPFAADSFFMKESLSFFTFGRDAKGIVDKLTLNDDGVALVSVRSGEAAPERKAVVVPSTVLDTYAGRFELQPGFVIELTRDGEKFFGQATGQRKFELMPVSATTFYVKEVDAEIRFNNGSDKLVLLQGGREMPATRLK
jgi:D-alanyl-D-alanine carboxypeptidase